MSNERNYLRYWRFISLKGVLLIAFGMIVLFVKSVDFTAWLDILAFAGGTVGVFTVLAAFMLKTAESKWISSMLEGLALILVSVVVEWHPEWIYWLIPLALGLMGLITGAGLYSGAYDLKKFGGNNAFILIAAIVTSVGLFLLDQSGYSNENRMTLLIGAESIVFGIVVIKTSLYLRRTTLRPLQ